MKLIKGDITETELLYVAHGCNLSGVFNKGVAKAVREKWPQAFQTYNKFWNTEYGVLGGHVDVHVPGENEKVIGNLFTQKTYGNTGVHATYYHVIQALKDFVETHNAKRVAIPKIGCSLGGLHWPVMEILLDELEKLTGCEFHVYFKEE